MVNAELAKGKYMINPWFKFFGSEYLSDPKIGSLTPQERSCWITLMCLSSTSSVAGTIEYLTVEVLLEKSGIKFDPYHPEEWDACISILEKFERMRMIKKNENWSIEITNWSKRQESAMTVTERVRKYRIKQKKKEVNETDVTKGNETANDRIEENRIEKNRRESLRREEDNSSEMISQVNEFINLFKNTNPSYKKFFANKTQRLACERLLEVHGFEKLEKILKLLPKSNTTPYMPTITTPLQLEDKFGQLASAWLKKKNNENIIL